MVNVAINSNGEVIRQAKLPTSTRSLEDFFSTIGEPVQAVVECTSNWYWLSDWCRANGVDLTLAHAKMVKAISYGKVKTDKVDAKTLAELLRADLIPEAYQIQPGRRKLRKLTRGRLRLIQWRGRLQSTLWNQAITCNAGISGSQWRELKKLQQWLGLQLPEAANLQAQLLLEQISQLQEHIHRIEDKIEKQTAFDETVQRLLEVLGLGVGWCPVPKIAADPTATSPAIKMETPNARGERLLGRRPSPPIHTIRWERSFTVKLSAEAGNP